MELLVSRGNKKIGQDTLIMNLHTATDCPAADQCILRGVCYALANERVRPTVLAFRKRQEQLWGSMTAQWFIDQFKNKKSGELRWIRFQEAGDFASQDDLDKLSEVAEGLRGVYQCYTYTCRADLNYGHKSDNLVITGSHFMVDNMFVPLKASAFDLIARENPQSLYCANDCRRCNLCKLARNSVIYQKIH